MASKKPVLRNPDKSMNLLSELINRVRLVWFLFMDARVSNLTKLILPGALLYLISPVDFVPDVLLGFGQLDDFGIILLGMALFVKLCPPHIVEEYIHQIEYGDMEDDEAVDTTYRVVDEE